MGRQIEVEVHATILIDTFTDDIDKASNRALQFVRGLFEVWEVPEEFSDIEVVDENFEYMTADRGGDGDLIARGITANGNKITQSKRGTAGKKRQVLDA